MKWKTEMLMPVVVISAAATAGRILFNFIPQVQPVTAMVILTGLTLGPLCGAVTGFLSAMVSNMVLGQGIWTLFQMLAWGLIGFVSGFFSKSRITRSLPFLCFFGFLSGALFSLVTDLSTVFFMSYGVPLSGSAVAAVFATGLLFNIPHCVGNVFFLLILYIPFVRKFRRLRDKYGFLC